MRALAFSAALAAMASPAMADPVEGIWQTRKDDDGYFGHVEIKPCGPAFCGTLIKAFDSGGNEVDSPSLGSLIVIDMVAYPDGLYDDGQIFSPDRGKVLDGDMTLVGDTLSVRGCIKKTCRDGGTWKRVD